MSGTLPTSRLAQLARRSPATREPGSSIERCELCGRELPPEHRHLLEIETRELACACRPCALLFDRGEVTTRYRAVPERRLTLDDLELTDALWDELRLPVDIAFFLRTAGEQQVQAFYPGPMGATESLLRLEAWDALVAANPVLATLDLDVEALLVNRAHGARRHWVVPIDECFALVGLFRTRWRGLTGGKEIWQELDRFFAALDERARPASRHDTEEPRWAT